MYTIPPNYRTIANRAGDKSLTPGKQLPVPDASHPMAQLVAQPPAHEIPVHDAPEPVEPAPVVPELLDVDLLLESDQIISEIMDSTNTTDSWKQEQLIHLMDQIVLRMDPAPNPARILTVKGLKDAGEAIGKVRLRFEQLAARSLSDDEHGQLMALADNAEGLAQSAIRSATLLEDAALQEPVVHMPRGADQPQRGRFTKRSPVEHEQPGSQIHTAPREEPAGFDRAQLLNPVMAALQNTRQDWVKACAAFVGNLQTAPLPGEEKLAALNALGNHLLTLIKAARDPETRFQGERLIEEPSNPKELAQLEDAESALDDETNQKVNVMGLRSIAGVIIPAMEALPARGARESAVVLRDAHRLLTSGI